MLMVIFGAGASFDSSSAFTPGFGPPPQWRPPLANQLFDPRRFGDFVAEYPKCHPLVTQLQAQNVNVEKVLEKYQNEAKKDIERVRQLAAIRYYLQGMLSHCLLEWRSETRGVTNYKTLVDLIRHRRQQNEKICLVTFNYDTLLEDAVLSVTGKATAIAIDEYVNGDYVIVKLHGSINWAHEVPAYRNASNQNPHYVINEIVENAPVLEFGKDYKIIPTSPMNQSYSSNGLFPALAIPVENKSSYECPESHLKMLMDCLPEVTKVLVIGWKAAEEPFLKTLANGLSKSVNLMVISSNHVSANAIVSKMKSAGIGSEQFRVDQFREATWGFSQSLVNGEAETFLTQ